LGVIGIDHENLTANPLRLGNSSRVVMGERCVEPLGDRPHWPAAARPALSRAPARLCCRFIDT
jgi:hypothetical protein